jgi:hypothetical protein
MKLLGHKAPLPIFNYYSNRGHQIVVPQSSDTQFLWLSNRSPPNVVPPKEGAPTILIFIPKPLLPVGYASKRYHKSLLYHQGGDERTHPLFGSCVDISNPVPWT